VIAVVIARENKMDNFGRFIRSLDDSIRHLYCVGDSNAKRHQDCKLVLILLLLACYFFRVVRFILASKIKKLSQLLCMFAHHV